MTQNDIKAKLLEYRLSMLFDAITTIAGAIGTFISHFWFDSSDWFVICGIISCFSLNNFADSHEKYIELINERNNDN